MTERFIPSHSVSINQFSAKVMDQLILLTQHGKGYRAPSRSITLSIVEARVLRAWLDKVTPHDAEQEQRAAQLFEEGPALETGVTRPKEVQPSGSPAVEAVADEAAGRLLPCGCDRARTAKWVRRQCGCLPLEQDLRGDPTDI